MDIEAINSLIDDYKGLIESYRKENKHLRELQRNMDKQYQELEEQLDNASNNYTKYIQERDNVLDEIRENIEDKIYSIEPKGTRINYNCEYDSEEDFISAMEEKSRLNTLKEVLQILDKVGSNEYKKKGM